jgi:hypothetical protein
LLGVKRDRPSRTQRCSPTSSPNGLLADFPPLRDQRQAKAQASSRLAQRHGDSPSVGCRHHRIATERSHRRKRRRSTALTTESPRRRRWALADARRRRWSARTSIVGRTDGGNLIPPHLSAAGANHADGVCAVACEQVRGGGDWHSASRLQKCWHHHEFTGEPESEARLRRLLDVGRGLLSEFDRRQCSSLCSRRRGSGPGRVTPPSACSIRAARNSRASSRSARSPLEDRASAPRSRRAGRVDQRAAAAPAGRGGRASTLVRAAGSYGWQRFKTLGCSLAKEKR